MRKLGGSEMCWYCGAFLGGQVNDFSIKTCFGQAKVVL